MLRSLERQNDSDLHEIFGPNLRKMSPVGSKDCFRWFWNSNSHCNCTKMAWYRNSGMPFSFTTIMVPAYSTPRPTGDLSAWGKWLRYTFGLTFLDPNDVHKAFTSELLPIRPACPKLAKFSDYLVNNYIGDDAKYPPTVSCIFFFFFVCELPCASYSTSFGVCILLRVQFTLLHVACLTAVCAIYSNQYGASSKSVCTLHAPGT
jgi:hypothetical protein